MQLLQDQVLRDQVLHDQALHDQAGGAHWLIPSTATRTVVTVFSTLVSMAVYLSYVPARVLRSMGRTTSATLESRPVLLTVLLVLGVMCGLAIAALLSRDPREAAAYAVACLMIGGAIAVGDRAAGVPNRAAQRGSLVRASDVQVGEASEELVREMRAVAHDLRGPLLTVSLYLDLIEQGAMGPVSEEARAALRTCASSTVRAQAVVEQTLVRESTAATSVGSSAGSSVMSILPRSEVELEGVMADVVGALGGSLRQRGGSVVVEGRLPAVRGDETSLFRVFENLVQNGIKFTPEGVTPLVVVRARRLLGGDVEVCVRDFGCGMRTPESRALASRSGGHGIGLTTVARLVTRMGGTLRFEVPPEGGTAVFVSLRGV